MCNFIAYKVSDMCVGFIASRICGMWIVCVVCSGKLTKHFTYRLLIVSGTSEPKGKGKA